MTECIEIAKRANGQITPPYVGCILLNAHGEKIAEGFRRPITGTHMVIHAERDAISKARESPRGGTIITTLEPCRSQRDIDKRTIKKVLDPCSSIIAEEGIARVIYGRQDASECGGTGLLRNRGIIVVQMPEFAEAIDYKLFRQPMEERHRLLGHHNYKG
ncbi:MAG: hypothetical protein ACP5NS_00460 [Candidatus Pacearchaeota archaeon]